MTRRIIMLGCAALAAAALAGCRADFGSAGGGTSSPSPVPSAPPSSAAPSVPASTVAACPAGSLRLAPLPGGGGAMGTAFIKLGVTNTSTRPCTVRGYPQFTLSHGTTALPVTVVDGGVAAYLVPVRTVTLAPGGTAGFGLAYSNVPGSSGTCPVSDRMHLRLPGQQARVVGPVQIRVCQPSMRVSPFLPVSEVP
jgi:hypothetical protein